MTDASRATLLRPFSREFVTYDLEFIDDGRTIDMVSIGMVSGDGRKLYAINREMDQRKLLNHKWMRENVWPHLPLKDLPETRLDWGEEIPIKKCRCAPEPGTKSEYSCHDMNGRLDMDHPDVRPMGQIRRMVSDFLLESHPSQPARDRDDIQMWAYYGAYDHVRLAQLWGSMIALPPHVPMLTHDLKSEAMRLGNPEMPKQPADAEHNSLADAEHNLIKARFLYELATGEKEKNE